MSKLTPPSLSPIHGPPPLPRVFGSFTLLKLIAEGARGDVYAALRPAEIDRFCAIKVLPDIVAARSDLVTALKTEALRVVRHIHGNVVPIYDIGTVDDQLFFIAELVEGADLATLLTRLGDRHRRLPVDMALFIAMEIAAAAGYLRRSLARTIATERAPIGITGRAVLLSTDGEVKLLHYGASMGQLARDLEATTDRTAVATAPELASSAEIQPATDVFEVGALLWRMLAGRRLPKDASAAQVLPAPSWFGGPVTQLPSDLTKAIDRLTMDALSANPRARPEDCDVLRGDLGTMLRRISPAGLPALGDFVRDVLGPDVIGDRTELGRLATAFEQGRRNTPSTGRVITLTRDQPRTSSRRIQRPPVDLKPGEVIPGTRYRVQSKLGEGGMGTVYLAEHVDIEKRVALKVLRSDHAHAADALQQFRQEARAASKIGSAYICDVTDFGEVPDGRVFFVMEYLDGQSLGRVLRRAPHLPPGRCIAILRQIAKALGAAHDKGIVHLDVKPDNIMLIERGGRADAVKVVDFGIAGLLHQGRPEDEIAGTPEYIAPERAAGRGWDSRSDIYSLGVLAYEMLSGAVPFHGKTSTATLTMQVKDPPEPLRRRAPDKNIPAPVEAAVMRLLEKNPAGRPQSMAEVEACLCEAQIESKLTTPWDDLELPAVDEAWRARLAKRMPAPGARPRRAVVFAALSIAAVAVAIAVYFAAIRKPRVVIKEVRVELTQTDELPEVAGWLMKADQAARSRHYVRPPGDSALAYIEQAESEAGHLGRRSLGADMLRRAYASALTMIGNELLKAELRDLAGTAFRDALLFRPDDIGLQQRADLFPDERGRGREGRRRPVAGPPSAEDKVRDAATRVFVALKDGRISEARLEVKALVSADPRRGQVARLADALRALAAGAWTRGHRDRARTYYEIVSELDPADSEARDRARVSQVEPTAVAPEPPPPPTPARTHRRAEPVEEPSAGGTPRIPRDEAGSRAAAEEGAAAMAVGHLAQAEEAFNRALRADPANPAAVGGLAEVAFERARYTEALDYARHASRMAPRSSRYLLLLGDAYFKLLRYEEALASYEKARSLAPGDDAIANRLQRVEAKLGRK